MPTSGGITSLKAAMQAVQSGGSSKSNLESYMSATDGMTPKQKQAFLLKRRADEARLQQLRGVFAAYDEDRDGHLDGEELVNAMLALGFEPSQKALQRFTLASPTQRVDLATVSDRLRHPQIQVRLQYIAPLTDVTTDPWPLPSLLLLRLQFVRVCMQRASSTPGLSIPEDNETTEARIAAVFQEFDTTRTGRVPLSTLLHVLAEVDAPTSLSVDEIQELLRMTGILNEQTLKDPRTLYAMEVDYRAFVRHLMFAPAMQPAAAAGRR